MADNNNNNPPGGDANGGGGEELFFLQLHLLKTRMKRVAKSKGYSFQKVGDYFNSFYNNYLSFELTGAQKRVLKEIRADLRKKELMNRLLQGDVGSGKTLVALLSMLIAIDNNYQTCIDLNIVP